MSWVRSPLAAPIAKLFIFIYVTSQLPRHGPKLRKKFKRHNTRQWEFEAARALAAALERAGTWKAVVEPTSAASRGKGRTSHHSRTTIEDAAAAFLSKCKNRNIAPNRCFSLCFSLSPRGANWIIAPKMALERVTAKQGGCTVQPDFGLRRLSAVALWVAKVAEAGDFFVSEVIEPLTSSEQNVSAGAEDGPVGDTASGCRTRRDDF
jgi:hypothetical protein